LGTHLLGPRERDQLLEPCRGSTGIDGLARELEALAEVFRVSACRNRAGRVQEDGAASASVRSREHVANCLRVLVRRATSQFLDRGMRNAELRFGIELSLTHVAVDDLADEIGAGGRKFVDTSCAV